MSNTRTACAKGPCVYWQRLSTSGSNKDCMGYFACHFLLKTGRARQQDKDGRCLEYKRREK